MKSFKETKKYIIDHATKHGACEDDLERAENAKTKRDLLEVVSDNLNWVSQNGLFTQVSIREYFSVASLNEFDLLMGDNLGFKNSGNWNSGDSNSGYRNSGAFCTDSNPVVWLFDSPTEILVRDWERSRPYQIMCNLNPNFWVYSSEMTEAEKKAHPSHETTGGYLKSISLHESWANLWGNLDAGDKAEFTSLPNFDADKFKEITGIDVNE